MSAAESFVQVAPDSSGKKIRNLQVEVVQPDGSVATVQIQVVTMVDGDGTPVDFVDMEWKTLLLEKLDRMIVLLESMASV